MATFRVGQRVRIVGPLPETSTVWEVRHLIGCEATIIARGSKYGERFFGESVWATDLNNPTGGNAQLPESCLRPAYDGHQPASWDALKDLWQPTPEVETA